MNRRRTEAKNILTAGEQKQRIPRQEMNISLKYPDSRRTLQQRIP
jgi:hypothetical protein